MAANRPPNHTLQGRPLKPALASNRTAKTPVAPRLAATPASTSGASPHTFPRVAAPPKAITPTPRSQPPPPALQPSLLEDSSTPARPNHSLLDADHVTPRSSQRKSRADSTNTTPTTGNDTPTHVRPKLLSAAQSESAVHQRPSHEAPRPYGSVAKARSIVSGRDAVRGPPGSRSPAYTASSNHAAPRITKDTGPTFFRADQARPPSVETQKRPPSVETQKRPATKRTPTFFYANGQTKPDSRNPSPDRSTVSRSRSPLLNLPHASHDRHLPSPIVSPPLSSVSSRSPYFPPPSSHSPSYRPPSPPKDNIHLSYRGGVSQIIGRTAAPSPAPALPEMLARHFPTAHQRNPSLGKLASRDGRAKRSSLSSIDMSSPEDVRSPIGMPLDITASLPSQPRPAAQSEAAADDRNHPSTTNRPRSLLSPMEETVPSPLPHVPDLAAEARRDRKVLDLEISNSSLLAINKSLEREIRKQKAELKRFRRLSRAGQFNVAAIDNAPADHLSPLDEEVDELPDIASGVGRPSSPFLSEPGDDFSDEDDEDSTLSSSHHLSPTAQAAKDALHRADDEERLQQDLAKHRELLLDTQRMNTSLQRCLTWTEDLIKHGKKALQYQVPSTDVKLGGRILTDDDDVDEDASTQGGAETEDEVTQNVDLPAFDDLIAVAMNGYTHTKHGNEHNSSDRHSGSITGSGSEKDSGVEFGTSFHTPMRPTSHSVEFGKPTPLRNPLLMSRENPGNSHSLLRPG